MIIKIDIDGVMRDLLEQIIDINNSLFLDHQLTKKEFKIYNVDEQMPWFIERYNEPASKILFDNCSYQMLYKANIYKNVKDAIDTLHSNGHKIFIVSSQKYHSNKKHTLDWLKKYKIYYDYICFTKEKFLVKGDIFIDDCPKMLLNANEDEKCIMINQPYNVDYKNQFENYDSLYEFVKNFKN